MNEEHKENKFYLGIDIGSTKTCAIIGSKNELGEIQIFGSGTSQSKGIKKGRISNIELASKSIREAVADAKRISGLNTTAATVSISGSLVSQTQAKGVVNLVRNEITPQEVERAIGAAIYNADMPKDSKILHEFAFNFIVDGETLVDDPSGMHGQKLAVSVNIFYTSNSNFINIKKTIQKSGLELDSIVLSSYASLLATKHNAVDEDVDGIILLDLGGHTSNSLVSLSNAVQSIKCIPVGSENLTSDLASALKTSHDVASKIKLNHSSLFVEDANGSIQVGSVGDSSKNTIYELTYVQSIAYARIEEVIQILLSDLNHKTNFEHIHSVLITGGFSNVVGLRDLVQEFIPTIPVVSVSPKTNQTELDKPEFSVAVGLLHYASKESANIDIPIVQVPEIIKNKKKVNQSKTTNLSDIKLPLGSEQQVHKGEYYPEEDKAFNPDELFTSLASEVNKPISTWESLKGKFSSMF